MTSTATQSQLPIQRLGLKIIAERNINHVTGRAEFPHQTHGRQHVDIDYRSVRLDDEKTKHRLDAVVQYNELVERNGCSKSVLVKRVADKYGASIRSIQIWAKNYKLRGLAGLKDKYNKPRRNELLLTESVATMAVQIAAWWAFRISNLTAINNAAMRVAAALASKNNLADVLAAIDCYYCYKTDRTCYPFKPFARWSKFDYAVWLGRACDLEDYRRTTRPDCDLRTSLCVPDSTSRGQRQLPNAKYRQREVNDFKVREGMSDIADGDDRHLSITQHEPYLDGDRTVFEVASTLPEDYRLMLIRAAQGNRDAKAQAMATRSIWWEFIPENIRQRYDPSNAAACFIHELQTAVSLH